MKFNDCFLMFITWSAMSIVNSCDALASDEATGSGEVSWRSEVASTALGAGDLAINLKNRILVWNDAINQGVAADEVHLMVEAPFERIRHAVEGSLASVGEFSFTCEHRKLAYLPDAWTRVLLSRHPEIREDLVQATVAADLKQAYEAGSLTAAELTEQMAEARVDLDSYPQYRAKIDALDATYSLCHAVQEKRYGLLGQSKSALSVQVLDVSMVFGHTATAVSISRTDTFPNPDFSFIKDKIVGRGTFFPSYRSPTLNRNVVPSDAFDAIHAAMLASSDGAKTLVSPSPLAWVVTPASGEKQRFPLVSTSAEASLVHVEVTPWDVLTGTESGNHYPQDLLLLPHGDVLLSARLLIPQAGWSQQIWRLHESESKWKAKLIWKGESGATQLALSADGEKVWFCSTDLRDGAVLMYTYEVNTDRLQSHSIAFTNHNETSSSPLEWQLMGNQLPAFFDRASGGKLGSGDLFLSISPDSPPPLNEDPWLFSIEMKSPRAAVMRNMIRPVRWRGTDRLWVEDPRGLAELDNKSGRVQRAMPLPLRRMNHTPSAFSFTPWAPRSLGAPTANWIATSFLQLHAPSQENPMPSVFSDNMSSGHGGRFFGMHVMDVNQGTPRFSALLGRADTLQAAARTANGRLLALGANAAYPDRGSIAALWDTTTGSAPVRLESLATCTGFSAMAFSWDGSSLWALCNRQLLRWRLPESLQDQASAGSFPDQVHQ